MIVELSMTPALGSSLLEKAEDFLSNIVTKKYRATYGHENKAIASQFHFNCYGFVNHLVQEASATAYQSLCQRMEELAPVIPRSCDDQPCPFNLFSIFQSLQERGLTNWAAVSLVDLQ